jgi:hypothetical protein
MEGIVGQNHHEGTMVKFEQKKMQPRVTAITQLIVFSYKHLLVHLGLPPRFANELVQNRSYLLLCASFTEPYRQIAVCSSFNGQNCHESKKDPKTKWVVLN